jgi:magnesium chelatase family protein
VARSIADLARVAVVRRQDVAEALAFRHRIPGRDVVVSAPRRLAALG